MLEGIGARLLPELRRRSLLDDPAVVDDGDPMRDASHAAEKVSKTKTAARERVVAVRRFDEPTQRAARADDAPPATAPRREGTWKIEEGAHGELHYEPVTDRPEGAA